MSFMADEECFALSSNPLGVLPLAAMEGLEELAMEGWWKKSMEPSLLSLFYSKIDSIL